MTKAQTDAWVDAARKFAEAYKDTIHRLAPTLRRIHGAMWTAYRQAGMPYGESELGLRRWLHKQGQAART